MARILCRGCRFAVLTLAGLALALVVGSCARPGPVPGVTDDELVFGMTTPLSGPAAVYSAVSGGARAWLAHVNERGGIHGRRIRLLVRDDGYIPGRAVANVTEMKGSVLAFVGMIGSACLGATKDVLAEAGVPNVAIAGNPRLFESDPPARRRLVFSIYPDYVSDGEFLAQQAALRAGARRLAVFYQNDEFGKAGLAGVRQGVATRPGLELAAEVPYEVQERELGVHALKLKESGADAVILYGINTHVANVVREMAKLDYRPALFGGFALSDRHVMFRLLGPLWEGAYFSNGQSLAGEAEADAVIGILLRADPSLAGRETTALTGAQHMMLALEGAARAGRALTRESYVRALEDVRRLEPLALPVAFGPTRHHGRNSLRLLRAGSAQDTSFSVLTPYQDFPAVF
jgi:ABC-type branched-subunit amino acid transport system substrate-binding protein